MSDEQEAAQAAVAAYRQQVCEEPALLSLLYDIDLLPEQITKMVNARRMIAFCECFKAMRNARRMIAFCECFKAMRSEQIAALFTPADSPANLHH